MTLILALSGFGVIAGLVTLALVTLDARRTNRDNRRWTEARRREREAYRRAVRWTRTGETVE